MTLNGKGRVFDGSEKFLLTWRISYFLFCPFRGDVYEDLAASFMILSFERLIIG